MKPSKEIEYRQMILSSFGNNPDVLRKIAKVINKMIPELDDYWDEVDAEYEMGRGAMPPGYMKRREK